MDDSGIPHGPGSTPSAGEPAPQGPESSPSTPPPFPSTPSTSPAPGPPPRPDLFTPPPPGTTGPPDRPSSWRRGRPIPLREMRIGETLDAGINLYRLHWKTLAGVAAFVLIPFQFL